MFIHPPKNGIKIGIDPYPYMYIYICIYIYIYIYLYTAYTMSPCRQGLEGLPASPDLPPVAAPLDRRAPRDGHGARRLRGLGRWRQRGGDGGGEASGKAMGEAMGKKNHLEVPEKCEESL